MILLLYFMVEHGHYNLNVLGLQKRPIRVISWPLHMECMWEFPVAWGGGYPSYGLELASCSSATCLWLKLVSLIIANL